MTGDEIKAISEAATPGVWGKAEDEDGVFIEVYDSYYIAEMVNGLKAEMLEANAALIPALVNAYRAGLLVHRDDVPIIEAQEAQIARLRAALAWYGEQARLARLIHAEGDAGRNALAADGGAKAREALEGEAGR